MNIKITGKEIKATESIKDYIAEKAQRIQKYFDEEFDVTVTIRAERSMQIAEMSVVVKGEAFRAVTEHKDLYASIDKDIDIIEGQIRKAKTKKDKQNKTDSIRQKEELKTVSEIEGEIIKERYYTVKPMTIEDAKLKMLEKPTNQFFTFINLETGKVNVIYKLKDTKNYGLIEPEE